MRKVFLGIAAFFGTMGAFIMVFGTWGTIDSGSRGVVKSMGKVTGEVKGEGFYTKTPFVDEIVEIDIRTKKEQVQASAASRDLQIVNAVVAINFNLDEKKLPKLYQTVGEDYLNVIIAPALQEAIKAGVANYTAEELVTKREMAKMDITRLVIAKLSPRGIIIDAANGVNIVNFNFSPSFNDAIEAKVTAEQNALASKNKLEQVKYEAEQAIVTARGKAEALRVEAQAIASNPAIVQLRAIEKWDGELPATMAGGAVPFLNLK